jgi:hypothetical protein
MSKAQGTLNTYAQMVLSSLQLTVTAPPPAWYGGKALLARSICHTHIVCDLHVHQLMCVVRASLRRQPLLVKAVIHCTMGESMHQSACPP